MALFKAPILTLQDDDIQHAEMATEESYGQTLVSPSDFRPAHRVFRLLKTRLKAKSP